MTTTSSTFDPEAYVFEQLGLIGMYSGMAQAFLETGDAAAFNYSMASLTARVRTVVSLMNPTENEPKEAGLDH